MAAGERPEVTHEMISTALDQLVREGIVEIVDRNEDGQAMYRITPFGLAVQGLDLTDVEGRG